MHHKGLIAASLAALQLTGARAQTQDGTNPCRAIALEQKENMRGANVTYGTDMKYLVTFDAEKAYECVKSVPLVADEATAMVDVFKRYFAFQSSLAYLKEPPKSYQRPAVDVMARFDDLKKQVTDGAYEGQYEFDLAVHDIIRGVHDYHFYIYAGTLNLFHWTLPESLTAVSSDGKSIPELFAWSDITGGVASASPVIEIEGKPAFAYLRDYLERTYFLGFNEVHADWNSLMENPAAHFSSTGMGKQSIHYSAFQTTPIYNGASLKGRFANGTSFEWSYKAGSTRDLTRYRYYNGSDIYRTEVKSRNSTSSGSGLSSSKSSHSEVDIWSVDEPTDESKRDELSRRRGDEEMLHVDTRELEAAEYNTNSLASRSTRGSVPYFGYPSSPDLTQRYFGQGGVVSGYMLKEDKVAVLSMPSFQTSEDATGATFSSAVRKFIIEAKAAGAEKVVVDVMGNRGGSLLLAYDVFRQFFPSAQPSTLFRTRAQRDTRTLGNVITNVVGNSSRTSSSFSSFDTRDLSMLGAAGELNAGVLLGEDNRPFASYDEYYGPGEAKRGADNYTRNAHYNLESNFMARALGFYVSGYGSNDPGWNETWAAKDIILLSDGLCGSTCAVLAALLKNDAGVRSVTVGGVPGYGPMQVAAGTRGHNVRLLASLSDAIASVRAMIFGGRRKDAVLERLGVSEADIDALPQTLDSAPWRVGGGGVNALDTVIRSDDGDVPRQFAYEGSNCRLFWTRDMVRDVKVLWRAAATYAGGNSSACVSGSVDAPGSEVNATVTGDVGVSYNSTWDNANSTTVPETNSNSSSGGGKGGSKDDDDSAGRVYGVGMTGVMTVLFVWALWL